MSNSEFENYLALIGKLLQLTRRQRESIGSELRDHLESRVADLMELGLDQSQAVKQALEEFGDAAQMAKNLQFVSQLNRRRWMMRFATFSIVGCFLAAVLTMALWPDNPRFGAPDRSLAVVQNQDDKTLASASDESPFNDSKEDPFGAVRAGTQSVPPVSPKRSLTVFELNDQIEKTLLDVADLRYEDIEWRVVRRDLCDRFKLNVITDPLARNAGLADEEAMSVSLSGLPLEICLKHLLKSKECIFIVKDGALIVLPIENAEDPEFLSIRSFDCRELIKRINLKRSSNKIMTPDGNGIIGGMGGDLGGDLGGGGAFFVRPQNSGSPETTASPTTPASQPVPSAQGLSGFPKTQATTSRLIETPEELLTHLVTSLVGDEDKWSDGYFNLKVVNGFLVVRSPRTTLSEVEVFLSMLDKNLRADAAAPVN